MANIGRRMMEEAYFDLATEDRLNSLIRSLPNGKIKHLDDSLAPDSEMWEKYISPYLDETWLTVPWFFAETYLLQKNISRNRVFSKL